MDLELSGKRALVTGSTTGIGEAIARVLALEGASVAVHGRDDRRGHRLADELQQKGHRAVFVKADLSVADDVVRLADQARAALGGIEILVNNAAIYPQHTWFEGSPEDWGRLYAVNVVPVVQLIQLLVPEMKRAGWGRVIQISSGVASKPFAHMPAYSASKAAINNATASLCLALAGSGVTVNAISAGLIRTAEIERWFYAEAKARGWSDDWNQMERNILKDYLPVPVGHIGAPEDIARLAAFLASPQASYINGAIVRVDGGSNCWAG
jgi:NAD(P)-dependent dehydrogenase (short-subunit alcohol dehydrogenase family)